MLNSALSSSPKPHLPSKLFYIFTLLAPRSLIAFTPWRISSSSFKRAWNHNLKPLHQSTSPIEWKPFAQPKFDEFASCTVGPWVAKPHSQSIGSDVSKYEVEEVMRSCGGAVQGIKELPLHLLFPEMIDSDKGEQRTYHNRADGGFVYTNDGSYSAGPEQCGFGTIDAELDSKLFMASLSFGRHRLWLNSTLDSVNVALKRCHDEGVSEPAVSLASSQFLEVARPTPSELESVPTQQDEINCFRYDEITWQSVLRVRMPNLSQAWSLARAKWERTSSNTKESDESSGKKEMLEQDHLVGSTEIELMSDTTGNHLFSDLGSEGYIMRMLAVTTHSKLARSAIRYYDQEGQLKSVAFMEGSIL